MVFHCLSVSTSRSRKRCDSCEAFNGTVGESEGRVGRWVPRTKSGLCVRNEFLFTLTTLSGVDARLVDRLADIMAARVLTFDGKPVGAVIEGDLRPKLRDECTS